MYRAAWISLCALALIACDAREAPMEGDAQSSASGPVIVGELFYPERIALPPDAELVLEVRDAATADQALLLLSRRPLEGRQVPIAFELTLPELAEVGQAVFRAGLVAPGGLLRVTEAVPVSAEVDVLTLSNLRAYTLPGPAFGSSWRCGDQRFLFGPLGEQQYLVAAGQSFELLADGDAYRSADGTVAFRIDGDTARLERGDGDPLSCRRLPDLDRLSYSPWRVIEIEGEPVASEGAPNMSFDADEASIAGGAGCNRYRGAINAEGKRLRIGPVTSTLMACPDDGRGDQERRFLAALGRVDDHRVSEDGRLLLLSGDQAVIVAEPLR